MALNFDKLYLFNPFAKFFQKSRSEKLEKLEREELDDSQGVSQEELELANFINYDYLSNPGSAVTYVGIQFEQYFSSKSGRIQKYRQMSRYPIVNDALNQICDDAMVDNSKGDILNLEILEEIPEHIEDQIRKIWRYLITEVYKFNERGWDLFRKWLIEGEIYIELILSSDGKDMIGIKVLPSHTMMPIYESGKIKAFTQTNVNVPTPDRSNDNANFGNVDYAHVQNNAETTTSVIFDKDQIAYSNYGDTGDSVIDVRGFLESAIKPFNQLNNLEDATVVYKLVRAPMRRLWNIYTGKMPPGKQNEFLRNISTKYKKKLIYNPDTGAMDSAQNIQSLTEDYWFTKDINGNGTTVDSIGGDTTFGDLDEVKFFQQNLYKALMLPRSRWEDPTTSMYSSGKSGEIQREEIKFARFVERLQRRFKYIILDPFLTLLRLRGIDERYINYKMFNVQFTKSNLFKEFKEMEIMESRLAVLASTAQFIYNPTENPTGFFAPEFAMRKMFLMSEDEYNWNKELLDKVKPSEAEQQKLAMMGGGAATGTTFGAPPEPAPEMAMGGGEIPPETPATPEVPETPTPESFNDKDSLLLKEWIKYDSFIKKRFLK